MYVHKYMCIYVHAVYIHVIYVCVYVCVNIYIYIYIYIKVIFWKFSTCIKIERLL